MDRSSPILITGGTGFVGKHLREELVRQETKHYAFSRKEFDLAVRDQADALFSSHRDAGVILHLASFQAAGDFPARHPGEQFFQNNLIHLHVLEAWRRYLPHARLIAVGTSCAYPSQAATLTEEKFMDGEIHGSVYAYGFTKRLLYNGIRAYCDQYGLSGSYVIPATMIGEDDDFNEETAHVTGALIGRFCRASRLGLPEVEIWGDGTQVREFMDVKDFVRVLLHLIPLCDRDIVNVGPGRGTSIGELARLIGRAADFRGKLVFNKDRYVGIQEKFMNTTKLSEKYGLRIDHDLSAGIERTVRWYMNHYEELQDRPKFETRPAASAAPPAFC